MLALRGLGAGLPVHVHSADQSAAERVNALMWDYPKRRFIPHQMVVEDAALATDTPVHIGWQAPHRNEGLLINLSEDIPAFFGRFDRVAEVVVELTKDASRERYRQYRHRGFPIQNHQLNDWERASA